MGFSTRFFTLIALFSLNGEFSWAQTPGATQVTRSIQILPVPPFDMVDDLMFGGQARTTPEPANPYVRVQVVVGCYGRNLRSVRNPISPESEIKMGLGLGPSPGLPIEVTFPGWIVKDGNGYGNDAVALEGAFGAGADFLVDPSHGLPHLPLRIEPAGPPPGVPVNYASTANAYGNVMQIQTSILASSLVSYNAQGGCSPSARSSLITYLNFIQNLKKTEQKALDNCMNEIPQKDKSLREAAVDWIGKNLFPLAQAGGDGAFPPGQDGGGDGSAANFKNWPPTYITSPVKNFVPNTGPGTPWTTKCENRVRKPNAGKGRKKLKDADKYIGIDGPMNFQYISHWSSNFTALELFVSFPGEAKFCGGFFSPLMLFTDARRPRFNGKSDMMNRPDPGFSAWVEPNAPGVFLALDRNGNARIDDATELFGEDELAPNGFEKLRQYDQNQDGLIDARDPIFKSLLFFHDKDGNGRSDAGEVTLAASSGLVSISLNYDASDIRNYASGTASSREHSRFLFRDKTTGKIRSGEVIDVWFGRR